MWCGGTFLASMRGRAHRSLVEMPMRQLDVRDLS